MKNILQDIRNSAKYTYNEGEAIQLWRDKVVSQPADSSQQESLNLIKRFNHLILSGFDVEAHYESLRDKEKFKELTYNEKLLKTTYEINNLHLINENLSSFAYYELSTKRKPKLLREKGKTGYQIINKVLRQKYDNTYYAQKITELLAALNVKKQVG